MMNLSAVQPANSQDHFRPELVAIRRRMLGLSQVELANRAGLSQATLSKIEQGLKAITTAQAQQLAQAMNCEPSFFTQPEREYGAPLSAHPMFRRRASVGQKVLDKVIAEFNVRLAQSRVMLRSVDIEPELVMPTYDPDEFGSIEEIAAAVRRAWYLPAGPLASLTECLERAGCVVMHCDMDQAKIDAASYKVPGLPPVIFVNRALPGDRLRFSLAHELGHIIMHRYPTPNMEAEADAFASALLMPAQDIGPELMGLSLAKAAYMKPVWKVSIAALIYRASQLTKLQKSQSEYLWRTLSAKGWRTREPASLDIPQEQPTLVSALIQHFLEDGGYTHDERGRLLHLSYDEVAKLYDLPPRQSGLRRVK
jgi:Zn-dependent peptidase ImmA (M78 family)/transcriptional regulator with XRE-family HTH domain